MFQDFVYIRKSEDAETFTGMVEEKKSLQNMN